MKPGIVRSIQAGYAAANSSWPVMGLFAGAWILTVGVIVGGVTLTRPPQRELEELAARAETQQAPDLADDAGFDLPEELAAPGQAVTDEAAATAAPVVEATAPEIAPMPDVDVEAEQDRIVGQWVGHAWPVLLVCALLLLGVSLWTNGGQIGYLAQRLAAGTATVADFVSIGKRAFVPLLLAWLTSAALMAGVGLVMVLGTLLTGFLGSALPEVVSGVLSVLLALALIVAVVWASVRLSFWFIAIVTERVGPIAGLKTSWGVTRRRWWPVFGLGVTLALLSAVAWLVLGLPAWAGGLAGGLIGIVGAMLTGVLRFLAGLYVGFLGIAASIRFYTDAKSDAPASPAATA